MQALSDATEQLNEPPLPSVSGDVSSPKPGDANGDSGNTSGAKSPSHPFKILDDSPEFIDMLSVITDKTLELKRFEMPAYWRLFHESNTLSYEDLQADTVPAPPLNQLMLHPADYRGGLFQDELIVRSVREYSDVEIAAGTKGTIYEIWGSADRAPLWLQVVVTPELPAGQTAESLKGKSIDFAGYFFKLQAYYPAKAKSSDRSMISPLFIGKTQLASKQVASTASSNRFVSTETMFALLAGLLILSFLVKNLVRSRQTYRSTTKRNGKSWDWIDEEKSLAEYSDRENLDTAKLDGTRRGLHEEGEEGHPVPPRRP